MPPPRPLRAGDPVRVGAYRLLGRLGEGGNPRYLRENGIGMVVQTWAPDWNDGFAFLSQTVDGREILETASINVSVRVPDVDRLLDQAMIEPGPARRNELWHRVDRRVMEEAVILPYSWGKVMLIRGLGVTNLRVHDNFAGYDLLALGLG